MTLWLCGQFKMETISGNIWDFQGIFNLKEDAVKACKNENYFIVPVEIDKELPKETECWPLVVYPNKKEITTTN